MSKILHHCPACLSPDIFPYRSTQDYRATREKFDLDRCPQCGLVITRPQPEPEEIGKYYETEDYVSHAAEAKTLIDQVYYRVRKWMAGRKKHLVSRYATGRRLVDIGAGTGFFAAYMRDAGYFVTAFEPSSTARKVSLEQHGLEILDVSALKDQPSHSSDIVTMWHVLEHVHDLDGYLLRITEILAPGGTLILALPNYLAYDARFYKVWWGAWDVPRHLWHFNAESVRRLIGRHGLSCVAMHGMPFDAWYVALLSEKYRKTGTLGYLRAVLIGTVSNGLALFKTKRSSSVIYVIRKTQ